MAWTVDGLSYDTRMKLTIDQTKVDAALTDFPVLVKLTDARFDWTHANADGFDIRFTESDGSTLCKYERERHDGADYAEYWVKVPAVSAVADTDFYMYYRTTDTADGGDPTNVWDTYFKAVWHLHGAAETDIDDSTANNNDVTAKTGTPDFNQAAKVYNGVQFVAASVEWLAVPNADTLYPSTDNFTVESWFKCADSATYRVIGEMGLGANEYVQGRVENDGKVFTYWRTADNGQVYRWTGTADLDNATWHYFAATLVFATPVLTHYVDGAPDNDASQTQANTWQGAINPGEGMALGGGIENTQYFNGLLDEIRLSKGIARSAAWIKGTFYSVSDTLLTYGTEEGASEIKTINGLAKASVKTVNGLAIASVKTVNGLA